MFSMWAEGALLGELFLPVFFIAVPAILNCPQFPVAITVLVVFGVTVHQGPQDGSISLWLSLHSFLQTRGLEQMTGWQKSNFSQFTWALPPFVLLPADRACWKCFILSQVIKGYHIWPTGNYLPVNQGYIALSNCMAWENPFQTQCKYHKGSCPSHVSLHSMSLARTKLDNSNSTWECHMILFFKMSDSGVLSE